MEEINIKDIFDIVWKKRVYILSIILAFVFVGIIYSYTLITPKYTSSTTLVLVMTGKTSETGTDSITSTDVTLNSKLVPTYSELVKSKKVLKEVINNLGLDEDEYSTIKNNVKVSSVEETEILQINVTYNDPESAANIANEIANVFSEKVQEIYKIDNVYLVDEAEVNENPSNINHLRDLLIFFVIGVVVAAAFVFVIQILDNTIKTEDDIERMFDLPVLASIPEVINNVNKNKKGGVRK